MPSPMAQPGPPPVQPPPPPYPYPPYYGPYGPPVPPYYPPPSKPTNIVLIVVVVVIVIVLVSVVVSAILYIMVSGLIVEPPPPSRPIVTFSTPVAITNGYSFTLAAASTRAPPGNYRVNLQVNSTTGTAVPLALSMTIAVPSPVSSTYNIQWLDPGGERTVNAGDTFEITRPGGMQVSTTFIFYLLWIDGTQIQSLTYRT